MQTWLDELWSGQIWSASHTQLYIPVQPSLKKRHGVQKRELGEAGSAICFSTHPDSVERLRWRSSGWSQLSSRPSHFAVINSYGVVAMWLASSDSPDRQSWPFKPKDDFQCSGADLRSNIDCKGGKSSIDLAMVLLKVDLLNSFYLP